MMTVVVVVTMVVETEGFDPIDQGVQGVCRDMDTAIRWIHQEWSNATLSRFQDSNTWEIKTKEGVSLEAFLILSETECIELQPPSSVDTTDA